MERHLSPVLQVFPSSSALRYWQLSRKDCHLRKGGEWSRRGSGPFPEYTGFTTAFTLLAGDRVLKALVVSTPGTAGIVPGKNVSSVWTGAIALFSREKMRFRSPGTLLTITLLARLRDLCCLPLGAMVAESLHAGEVSPDITFSCSICRTGSTSRPWELGLCVGGLCRLQRRDRTVPCVRLHPVPFSLRSLLARLAVLPVALPPLVG